MGELDPFIFIKNINFLFIQKTEINIKILNLYEKKMNRKIKNASENPKKNWCSG